MATSNESFFEMDEYCPKCGKNIILRKDGYKYSMKEANENFVMITYS